MDAPSCPICRSSSVLIGAVSSGGDAGYGCVFLPPEVRVLRRESGVPIGSVFRACLACGHVWSAFDPAKLRAFLEEHGTELGRQYLDELDRGPNRDLPETEVGRAIGARVAELDALARARSSALVRRYRDLLNVTWDEAIQAGAAWPRLTREEKLELFGWVAKKKPMRDDLFE